MILHGWFQIAFESELAMMNEMLIPVQVGSQRLMLIRESNVLTAYDAVCPHRGASLAHGGQVKRGSVICPFHGLTIELGCCGKSKLEVAEYMVLSVGGLVFVRFGVQPDGGFSERLTGLARDWRLVPGFVMTAQVPHALVIENAFDGLHFPPVHRVLWAMPVQAGETDVGTFVGHTILEVPSSPWQRTTQEDGNVRVPMTATAYGAGVIISEVGGPHPYVVLTTATPNEDSSCTIRLSMGFPKSANEDLDTYMIGQARKGLGFDKVIWEHMCHDHSQNLVEGDEAVAAFQHYCRQFIQKTA
jgi:phenylpropionate dioxygenase-like ring-hydroxylating dioxygenase large terminal subunit